MKQGFKRSFCWNKYSSEKKKKIRKGHFGIYD